MIMIIVQLYYTAAGLIEIIEIARLNCHTMHDAYGQSDSVTVALPIKLTPSTSTADVRLSATRATKFKFKLKLLLRRHLPAP